MTDVEIQKIITGVAKLLRQTPVTPTVDTMSKQEVEVLLLKQELSIIKRQESIRPPVVTTNQDSGLDINKLLSYKMLSGIF